MDLCFAEGPSALPRTRNTIFIPMVSTKQTATSVCFGNPSALAFYHLLSTDERQQRTSLTCCPSLVEAAKKRAYGLTHGDPWSHVDAAGLWPNQHARAAGCNLPDFYPEPANNIESLVAGSPNVGDVFEALAQSQYHAPHLFGQNDFFREQGEVGIALAEGGVFGWYWVVLIAVCLQKTSGE